MPAENTLDREYLPLRAKIIEIAAALDRIDRSNVLPGNDERMQQIQAGLETVLRADSDRAERVQLIFSRPYEDNWMRKFRISTSDE